MVTATPVFLLGQTAKVWAAYRPANGGTTMHAVDWAEAPGYLLARCGVQLQREYISSQANLSRLCRRCEALDAGHEEMR